MATSQAWVEFLENLREATALLRADPSSAYAAQAAQRQELPPPTPSVPLTNALTKGCVLLTSGRLQGCVESQTQEFLERVDQSGVVVDQIPESLRAALSLRFLPGRMRRNPSFEKTAELQKRYAPLWTAGVQLAAGTIKTDSLPDDVWNPWPHKVAELMRRCDIDLYGEVERAHGRAYLADLEQYVGEVIEFRNQVAHGDEPAPWTARDVRLRMKWCTRLARSCDLAFGQKLHAITGAGW